jgi:hypothetical protein
MQLAKAMTWAKFQVVQPLGESSKNIGLGLLFGMMPILIAWLILVLFGLFPAQYESALVHGDVLMIATSLAGPAMIAIFKKRDPETIGQPEIVGLLGLLLIVVCALVFAIVNTAIVSTDFLASKLTLKVDIIRVSWILLAFSTLYALYIEFHEARSGSLAVYRSVYAREQHTIEESLTFPGGQQ